MKRKVTLQVRRISDTAWADLIVRLRALGDVKKSWYKDKTIERYTVEVDEEALPALRDAFGDRFFFLDSYPMGQTWFNGKIIQYAKLFYRLWPEKLKRGSRLIFDFAPLVDAIKIRKSKSPGDLLKKLKE